MNLIQSVAANAATGTTIVLDGIERRVNGKERDDVPGWMLIMLMTAGLVTALWTMASTQLAAMFTSLSAGV